MPFPIDLFKNIQQQFGFGEPEKAAVVSPYSPSPEEKQFLDKMSSIESSKGQDIDHATIRSPDSIQAGDAAIGRYGIMPNTAKELYTRAKLQNQVTPELEPINQLEGTDLKDYINTNPNVEDELATRLYRHIKSKPNVDDDTADYMWQYGHNKVPDRAKVEASPRTEKFRKLKLSIK